MLEIIHGRHHGRSAFAYEMAEMVAKHNGTTSLICTEQKEYVFKVMSSRGVKAEIVEDGVRVSPLEKVK